MAYGSAKSADFDNIGTESASSVFENYPVLRYTLPLAAGIALGNAGRGFLDGSAYVFLAAAAVSAVILVALLFVRRPSVEKTWFGAAASVFFICLGVFSFLRSDKNARFHWPDSATVYEGVITDSPIKYGKVTRMKIRLTHFKTEQAYFKISPTIELAVAGFPAAETLKTGDGVVFSAKVRTPTNSGNPYEPDYAASLLRSGVSGTAFSYGDRLHLLNGESTGKIIKENLSLFERLSLYAKMLRDRLQSKYGLAGINGESLAVLSALTLGDRHLIERQTRDLFAVSGVSHILALSGLHLGIIYGILQFLFTAGGFARRARTPAQIVIIAIMWAYAVMAGLPPSLVRAAIMYSIVSLAVILERKAVTLNNLYAAAFIILLFRPMLLFDIGFQLSFVSVFFILTFVRAVMPVFALKRPLLGKLWGIAAVSVCAQIGVTPLVAYYFNYFPVYFLFSNFIAVPAAFLLVVVGFTLLALSWMPAAANVLAWALSRILRFLLDALNLIGGLPAASLPVYPSLATVLLIYAAVFFVALYFKKKNLLCLVSFACCCIAATGAEAAANTKERDVAGIYFYKGLSCPAVHFVVSRDESYIYAPARYADADVAKSLSGVARHFWKRCGISEPTRLPRKFSSPFLIREGCMVQFGRKRYCILDTAFIRGSSFPEITADVVCVARGFSGGLPFSLKQIRAGKVILGERLPQYCRDAIIKECDAAGVEYYDINMAGALKLPVR